MTEKMFREYHKRREEWERSNSLLCKKLQISYIKYYSHDTIDSLIYQAMNMGRLIK